ncbi:MAG: TetR/AcrR family transcriptional regulator [Desulfocapsaceae bacterium]|nr:TetR/AcrR family transcriptional regulator [Desulfocapsaceae bacterium]
MGKQRQIPSRQRILASAKRLFARQGFASTGVRELADDAGVNLAMVNYFFGSKKELLKEILADFFSGYLEILRQELQGDGSIDEKIRRLIHRAIAYIEENQDSMLVTLAELPHDDPDITEYKAEWAKQAMLLINKEICEPLGQQTGQDISPAAVGPLLISMMCSRFLFSPIIEKVRPPFYQQQYLSKYPEIIEKMFLHGIHGLQDLTDAEE